MIEKYPLEKLCFVLEIERLTTFTKLAKNNWNYVLRWIELPYRDVVEKLKSNDWQFTLRPAYESGWVTADYSQILRSCTSIDDLPEVMLKLSLLGVNPAIMVVEDGNSLQSIEDLTTGKTWFKAIEEEELS